MVSSSSFSSYAGLFFLLFPFSLIHLPISLNVGEIEVCSMHVANCKQFCNDGWMDERYYGGMVVDSNWNGVVFSVILCGSSGWPHSFLDCYPLNSNPSPYLHTYIVVPSTMHWHTRSRVLLAGRPETSLVSLLDSSRVIPLHLGIRVMCIWVVVLQACEIRQMSISERNKKTTPLLCTIWTLNMLSSVTSKSSHGSYTTSRSTLSYVSSHLQTLYTSDLRCAGCLS